MKRLIDPLLALLALVPLAIFVYLGQFSRFISDDYKIIATGLEMGAWDGMHYWLNTSFASYTSNYIVSLLAPLNTLAPRLMPALFIVIWLVGLVWLVSLGLKAVQVREGRRMLSLAVGALTLAAIINAFYSPQSLFWFHSINPYGMGLALFTLFVGLAIWLGERARSKRDVLWAALAAGIICFLSAGISEMHTVAQLVFLSLCNVFLAIFWQSTQRRRYLPTFAVAWLATVCSLLIQLSLPAVALRAEANLEIHGAPLRDLSLLISETISHTLRFLGNANALAGYVLLLAAGLLLMLFRFQPKVGAVNWRPAGFAVSSLLLGLLVQLLFVPYLWSHISDAPLFFGRFSMTFMLVVIVNLASLFAFLALVRWPNWINRRLMSCEGATILSLYILSYLLICAALLVIIHVLNIEIRARLYLVMSALVALAMIMRQTISMPQGESARRFGCLALFLPASAVICLVALVLVALFGQGFVPTRVLEPVASLLVLSGLVWGAYLGYLYRHIAPSKAAGRSLVTIQKMVCLPIIFAVTIGMMIGQASLIPGFRVYANEWDRRHQEIIALRDSGKRVIEVAPLTVKIENYVGKAPLGKEPPTSWAELYYDVDKIIVRDGA